MQILWWEEIDCSVGKGGYKCENGDAGICQADGDRLCTKEVLDSSKLLKYS